MSNFSFSHSVFKVLVLQTGKNQGLFGKGLTQMLSFLVKNNEACSLRLNFSLTVLVEYNQSTTILVIWVAFWHTNRFGQGFLAPGKNVLTLSQTSPGFHLSAEQTFWKHCGKRRNFSQFLLFPQHFLPVWRTFCHFHNISNCRLQTLSVWKSVKFVIWERLN